MTKIIFHFILALFSSLNMSAVHGQSLIAKAIIDDLGAPEVLSSSEFVCSVGKRYTCGADFPHVVKSIQSTKINTPIAAMKETMKLALEYVHECYMCGGTALIREAVCTGIAEVADLMDNHPQSTGNPISIPSECISHGYSASSASEKSMDSIIHKIAQDAVDDYENNGLSKDEYKEKYFHINGDLIACCLKSVGNCLTACTGLKDCGSRMCYGNARCNGKWVHGGVCCETTGHKWMPWSKCDADYS